MNDPPRAVAEIIAPDANEDSPYTLAIEPGTFIDPDVGDILTYLPPGVMEHSTGVAEFLPFTEEFRAHREIEMGQTTIRLTATDKEGLSAHIDFELRVRIPTTPGIA